MDPYTVTLRLASTSTPSLLNVPPMPDYPWRIQSRPCPFYSQGKCLFSDSCNFLHDVKVKSPVHTSFDTKHPLHVNMSPTAATPTHMNYAPSLASSPRSPPRCPRMSGLLLALQDVIGPTPDDDEEEEYLPVTKTDPSTNESHVFTDTSDSIVASDNSHTDPSHSPIHSTSSVDNKNLSVYSDDSGVAAEEDHVGYEDYQPEDDDQLTIRAGTVRRLTEGDSGPEFTSTQSAGDQPSDFTVLVTNTAQDRSSQSYRPLSLLSPVEVPIKPLLPLLFHEDSASTYALSHKDSIDSGYADSWTEPLPFSRTPPQTRDHRTTQPALDMPFTITSPTSLPTSPNELYGYTFPSEAEGPFTSVSSASVSGAVISDFDVDPCDVPLPASPSLVEEQSPDLLGLVQEYAEAIERTSPLHFLVAAEGPSFEETEPEAHSSVADASPDMQRQSDADTRNPVSSPTPSQSPVDGLASAKRKWSAVIGELSMLSIDIQPLAEKRETPSAATRLLAFSPDVGPSVTPRSNTLDSVYGCYGSTSPTGPNEGLVPTSPAEPLRPQTASSSPMSVPGMGGRVFTPPLDGERFNVRRMSSPNVAVLGSPFQNHSSPTAVDKKAKGKGHARPNVSMDETPWDMAMDAGSVSSKAPFGFRYPFSLGRGHASSPSISSRPDQSIPPSRHTSHLSTDVDDVRRLSISSTSSSKDRSLSSTRSSSPSPVSSTRGLRPLRLSSALISRSSSISSSLSRISSHNNFMPNVSITQSPSVSSDHSLSNNPLLSSSRSSLIPQHIRNTLIPPNGLSSWIRKNNQSASHGDPPLSAPISHSRSWRASRHSRAGSRIVSNPDRYPRPSSRLSEPAVGYDDDEDTSGLGPDDTIRNPLPGAPYSAPVMRSASVMPSPRHAIATPPPTLLFAIASDDVDQVNRVLQGGDAGPNDHVGPQSALAFTLTNDKLKHKMEIVKALLAFGADPSVLKNPDLNPPQRSVLSDDGKVDANVPPTTLLEGMDPATRYYVARADAPSTRRTSQLIHRSFFRPLTRVRYDLIGQDCALEQLFRVLSMHSQQLSVAPLVVLLCGPSGHGKSLLARKFGSLLDVPTHTVNMTTLRSTHDLWQSYSMNPYEEPSNSTLAQFLLHNEGKRCVVVLDEIEKTEEEKALWSLLMPWELGRCSPEAGKRHIDVRNVIWLGTSNIGADLVFEYDASRPHPDASTTREEYLELTGLLRPRVSARLGASLLSRVTTVLPFVPFSQDEKLAIAAEALYSLAGEQVRSMSPEDVESLVDRALSDYLPAEGARSLYRAVSSQLVACI